MDISAMLSTLEKMVWSMPFLMFFFGTCLYMTIQLGFIQIRYLARSIKLLFHCDTTSNETKNDQLSPFQAFMNTLGSNIGCGCLTGIPVAIATGGPGAIFWMLVMSIFSVSLRFAEVFLATYFSDKATDFKSGPTYYLSLLPLGTVFSYLFGIFGLLFMLTGGGVIQCNAIGDSLLRAWNIPALYTAIFVVLFVTYVVVGGSKRIVKLLDKLVPIKVYGFLLTAFIVLAYHITAIPHALYLIMSSALNPQAVLGGSFGYAIQTAIAQGFSRGINASEAGVGTAALAFGATAGQDPVKNGIISMLGVYINTYIVCFLVALCVIASGVWNNGEIGIAMLVSAYETVFGSFGGSIVSVLVLMFAISVVVAYAYNVRICWKFLFHGKYNAACSVIYIACAGLGTVTNVKLVWSVSGIVTAGIFAVNVLGLLWFVSVIKAGLNKYRSDYAK